MNPVNATALYISASRLVLHYQPGDPQSFSDINKMLPFFRQSLACCVCGNLLQDPIAPINSTCQHYVCKTCKGKKMMMKPSCSWCKDYDQFEENKQLSILVSCYKKLCEYITQTPLAQDILDAVDSSADLLALLRDGSLLCEETEKSEEATLAMCLSHSPLPSTSELTSESEASSSQLPDISHNLEIDCSVNGLPNCNGLSVDGLSVTVPSPDNSNTIDVCSSTGDDLKTEDLSGMPSVCDAVSASDLCTDDMDICAFDDDIKPGDSLLLSVEEVLRSLESVSNTDVCDSELHHSLETEVSSRPFSDLSSHTLGHHSLFMSVSHTSPHGISYTAATPKIAKLNRKRSRSESDSEKVQPLPISTILCGPTLGAPAPVMVKQEKISLQPMTVPNGGSTPKIGKTLFLSKSMKKNQDHLSKKSHPKSKPGLLKTKEKLKIKIPICNNMMPGSPTKTVYKKPQEKKGCKCGRATQNPSVLTCRGQRCPCYSNRKACLDCICRGCQNSYMANGEKKLEAFAVPEKALEQTRLTLGINVTSIAVRTASTSSGVLNVTAGSPVATFLAATAHDEKSLDEAIDMRYDC
ncbi:E3 ubiquitin-protein ligase MSL2 [Ambystoma mexicanum]|uniref:E3 ubiquitin-protein ligase MSL2 n=1 Tax=Ambystoma mexicanum TaxID=8296 RepID=UPI0037E6FAE5